MRLLAGLTVALLAVTALVAASGGQAGCCEAGWTLTPSWLPDGETILVAQVTEGSGDVELVTADGTSEPRTVAGSDERRATLPHASRDGRRIVYVAYGLGIQAQLASMDAAGNDQRLLGAEVDRTMEIALSPDDETVAFVRPPSPDGPLLALLDLRTLRVADVGRGWEPTWSPRGDRLAFVRDGDIWLGDANGAGARNLTLDSGDETRPTWTADGSHLAYVYRASPGARDSRIEWVDAETGTRATLRAHADAPAFSHDGRGLGFVGYAPHDDGDLRTLDLQTGQERRLGALASQWVAFSPDDSKIAFTQWNGNGSGLAVIGADGRNARGLLIACLPDRAPPLVGCSAAGGYTVPATEARQPLRLRLRRLPPHGPGALNVQASVRDALSYRVRAARIRLQVRPASAGRVSAPVAWTDPDGVVRLVVRLRSHEQLGAVRFVLGVLGSRGQLLEQRSFTCHDLEIGPARGCPKRR